MMKIINIAFLCYILLHLSIHFKRSYKHLHLFVNCGSNINILWINTLNRFILIDWLFDSNFFKWDSYSSIFAVFGLIESSTFTSL